MPDEAASVGRGGDLIKDLSAFAEQRFSQSQHRQDPIFTSTFTKLIARSFRILCARRPRHGWPLLLPKEALMRVHAADLHDLYCALARYHGADDRDSGLFADCLLDADLRNHQTQGIGLLPYY